MMLVSIIAIVCGIKLLTWGLDRANEGQYSFKERRLRAKMKADLDKSYLETWKKADYDKRREMYEARINDASKRNRW